MLREPIKILGGYRGERSTSPAWAVFGRVSAQSFGLVHLVGGPIGGSMASASSTRGNRGKSVGWALRSAPVGMARSEWRAHRIEKAWLSRAVRQIAQLRLGLVKAGGVPAGREGGRPPFAAPPLPRALPLADFRDLTRPLFTDRPAQVAEMGGRAKLSTTDRGSGLSRGLPARSSSRENGVGVEAYAGLPTLVINAGAGVSRAERARLSGIAATGKGAPAHG